MKTYLLRLDKEDQRRRRELMTRYRNLHGRPVPFADIVRELLREKHARTTPTTNPALGQGVYSTPRNNA